MSEKSEKIAVIGGGTMGVSLAALFLVKGFDVVVKTRRMEAIPAIKEKIELFASKIGEKHSTKLDVVTDYSRLGDVVLAIEAIEENLDAKKQLLAELEQNCPNAFYASNTSSLSITEIAVGLRDKTRFAGMHFFNPAHKMQLVEVVKTQLTSAECANFLVNVSKKLGKTPVIVSDSPGFVVNRLLVPFLLDAVELYENGVADFKDIDTAVKLGLNHPMGPFELIDLIGMDVFLSIVKQLNLQAPQSVVKMVENGKLGRKTKQGFYSYG